MRITTSEIRRIEEAAMLDYGISSLLLMENAGRSVSDIITRHYPSCNVLVLAGKGNNGGDGLVVARHLAYRGYEVKIVLLADSDQLKKDPLVNFTIVRKMVLPVTLMTDALKEDELQRHCLDADLLVDAILGVGIQHPVCGIFEKAIRVINGSQRPVVSIDIPSGLDADTGEVRGIAVKATRTVTLALPKAGLFVAEGPAHAGKVDVVDIGIPKKLLLPFLQ